MYVCMCMTCHDQRAESLHLATPLVFFVCLFICLFIRFDVDLNAAKDDSNSEVHAREKLAREMSTLQAEHGELKEKLKVGKGF